MATYITDAELKASVAARMKTTVSQMDNMGPHVAVLVSECNQSAYDFIVGLLVGRGYTVAQIDLWDARKSWSLRIGACHVFRALSANTPVQSYIDPNAGVCKAEKDLEAATIVISGAEAALGASLPISGDMTNTAGDLLLLDDIRDSRTEIFYRG